MLNLETRTDISCLQNDCDMFNLAEKPGKPINFAKMREAGATGVAIRKTLGVYHDPWFERNWLGAGDAELRRTVYCVPYVAYSSIVDRQLQVISTWQSGGDFDGQVDDPAWCDAERKHNLGLQLATNRLLPYMFHMQDVFGSVEIYTGLGPWQSWYSNKKGWIDDWGLVVANYVPYLYTLTVEALKERVAKLLISPSIPQGWKYDRSGNLVLPTAARWRQWQISADGNVLGEKFGVHSRDIDISFRQVESEPSPTPPPAPPPDIVDPELVRLMGEAKAGVGSAVVAMSNLTSSMRQVIEVLRDLEDRLDLG